MQIPFGSRKPDDRESALLMLIGFDLEKLEFKGRYYFLTLPTDPKIKCTVKDPTFDRSETTVTYNGVTVISINQKTAMYDQFCYFTIRAKAVEEALNAKPVAENKADEGLKPDAGDKKAEASVELTEFQERLAGRLSQVELIVSGAGAESEYGLSMLEAQLENLRELKKENSIEHDQLINSKEKYKKLLAMFPNWANEKSLLNLLATDNDGVTPRCIIC